MKKLFSLVLILTYSGVIYAQGNFEDRSKLIQEYSKTNNYSTTKSSNSKFNVFLNENWQGGIMITKDSLTLNGYTFRYNVYSDQIELRSIVSPKDINVVSIGTQKFVYSSFINDKGEEDEGYFELVVEGDCRLLLRREIEFSVGTKEVEGYGTSSARKINEDLYIKFNNGEAKKIMKSKDFFLEVMAGKDKAVEYVDKQFILFMTEKKIKRLVEYYNKI